MPTPVNTAYFTGLTDQVNAAQSCSELQVVAAKALAASRTALTSAEAQLALVTPMLALLTAPTNPTEVITYIQTLISAYLTPQLSSSVTLTAQIAAATAAIASLESAIQSKAGSFPNCTVP